MAEKTGKDFSEWSDSAQIGDEYDWYAETGNPTFKGTTARVVGFNDKGKPIIESIDSEERKNWRKTIGDTGGMTPEEGRKVAIKRLMDAGYSEEDAKFLWVMKAQNPELRRQRQRQLSAEQEAAAKANEIPGTRYVTNGGSRGGFSTGYAGTTGTTGMGATGAGGSTQFNNPYMPGTEEFKAFNERESAYNLLYQQMNAYGLGALVEPLKNLVVEGVSPSEFTIRLRDTAAYKQRFGANQARIQKGLRALSEAEYIGLEDQYQDVMRRYGLPQSYYQRGELGRQEGFEKFISSDVSPVELEDRIQTAYNRVINANPEVGIALRTFYPGITNGDILAYTLDPDKALGEIQRKITAAEIGGAAVQAGLTTNLSDAEYLARYGVTKEQAQSGYRTISGYLPRAEQLSSIYSKQVEGGPYTQASAEREVFNVPGAAEEERKRLKISSLEQAAFSGQSGLTGGALGRERAGQF